MPRELEQPPSPWHRVLERLTEPFLRPPRLVLLCPVESKLLILVWVVDPFTDQKSAYAEQAVWPVGSMSVAGLPSA